MRLVGNTDKSTDRDSGVPEAALPAVVLPDAVGLGLPTSPAGFICWFGALTRGRV